MSTLSIFDAANECPDAPALITDTEQLTFRAAAERAQQLNAKTEPLHTSLIEYYSKCYELNSSHFKLISNNVLPIVGAPEAATVIALYWALATGRTLALLHPRFTQEERSALLASLRTGAGADATAQQGAAEPDAVLLPTSGSTGMPALVRLSRSALAASARGSEQNLGWEPDDRWLVCLPLSHAGGLSIVTRCLMARRAVVLLESDGGPRAELIAEAVARHRVTLLSLVPTLLGRLLDLSWSLPSYVRAILVGGAHCPSETLARARERGWPVLTTWGMTETASQVTTESYEELQRRLAARTTETARDGAVSSRPSPGRPNTDRLSTGGLTGSVGRPLAGWDVRIQAGRIAVRGPALMSGYAGNADRPFVDADGWFDTGDVGRLDAEGNLYVEGRADSVIISGGENVHPLEVEAVLEGIPGVRSACVFGIPDAEWGARVAAALVTESPASPSDATLRAALSEKLADFKRPRSIARLLELPTGPTGKLDRNRVREAALPLLRELGR